VKTVLAEHFMSGFAAVCRTVTFQLRSLTGVLARNACPGTTYRLVVSWFIHHLFCWVSLACSC
jgi:hypothetical protein